MINKPRYRSVVVLTGAGVSAESGIQTFRASDGLWENHRVEEVATPEGFSRDPELVHHFYNQRRRQLLSDDVAANPAHTALARFETLLHKGGADFTLVTQNIDDLHERAGSQSLIHMHGELLKIRCSDSGVVFDCCRDISLQSVCDCCGRAAVLRPDIVWFGEIPQHMDEIFRVLSHCDLFLSIGTSGKVYPAAGFVQLAAEAGAHCVEINLEPSSVDSLFHEHHYGAAGALLPELLPALLASG